MTSAQRKLRENLLGLGFTQNAEEADLFVLSIPFSKDVSDGSEQVWTLRQWEVSRIEDELRTKQITVSCGLNAVEGNIRLSIQKLLGKKTRLDLVPSLSDGLWVIVEVGGGKDKQSNKKQGSLLPNGVFGFHISLVGEGALVSIQMSNPFYMGNIPAFVLGKIPGIISDAFALPGYEGLVQEGIFETTVDLYPAIEDIAEQSNDPESLMTLIDRNQDRKGRELNQRQISTNFDNTEGWSITINELDNRYMNLKTLPMEVVESRDLGRKFKRIDDLILAGESEKALDMCVSEIEDGDQSLFIYRRYSLLSAGYKQNLRGEIVNDMIDKDPKNVLFLSTATEQAFDEQNQKNMLLYLSALGENLEYQMSNLESADSFDMVLPEMLGDAWKEENFKTSELCYERVIEKRGELPRVLRKMVTLAQKKKDILREVELHHRLIKAETSKARKSRDYIRLAEIYQSKDPKKASEFAVSAWRISPKDLEVVLFASKSLCVVEEYQKAIRVLDDGIRHIKGKHGNRQRVHHQY